MISIIIPLVNERDSLAELHREMAAAAAPLSSECEFVFVDDGSTDGSWAEIKGLQKSDERVRGVRLRRNFGKSAALAAGLRAGRGEVIVTLDADLQDDPIELPRFLEHLSDGLDVISGWKRVRHDPWHKVLPSRVFNWLVSHVTGVKLHDHNCGFKCFRAEVGREIRLYGELHRFIPVLAAARGFRVGEIEVNHRPRRFGHSKFGASRFLKGFLDLMTVKFLTGFGRRPQHLLGTVGLAAFAFGSLSLTWLAITWVINRFQPGWAEPVHARALLAYAIVAVLFGTQLLSIGFLAELLTANHARDADHYSVAEEV